MNKPIFALAFAFLSTLCSGFSPEATRDAFIAVENADADAFAQALSQGADVNAVNYNNGCTLGMKLNVKIVDIMNTIDSNQGATLGLSILASQLTLMGSLFFLGESKQEWVKNISKSFWKGLGFLSLTTIGSGILAYKGLKKLMVTPNQKKLANYSDMLYALLQHPNLDLNVRHDLTGKTLINVITDILNPQYGTYTQTTYHEVAVGSNHIGSGILIPSTTLHVNATFMVLNTAYNVSQSLYDNSIKPFFEKVARFIYYNKGNPQSATVVA